MQQASATQSLHLSFWGLRKIVACSHSSSQCLIVSTVFSTVSSLHPTSFLMIFILVIIQHIHNKHQLSLVLLALHMYVYICAVRCVGESRETQPHIHVYRPT